MKTQQLRTANKVIDSAEYSAPGKVILCGEHAVVYGYPAIISSINLAFTWRIQTNQENDRENNAEHIRHKLAKKTDKLLAMNSLDEVVACIQSLFPKAITFESTIPQGSGLGSSAALAVSLAKLLLPDKATLEEIRELANSFEKMQHGNPSGGDITASCYGGLIWYQKNLTNNTWSFEQLKTNKQNQLPSFWLLNSGQPKESTKIMVEKVASLRNENQKKVDAAFSKMEEIAHSWKKVLSNSINSSGTTQELIHELINQNQKALETISVCSNKTLDLIDSLKKIGAAAKVTGAGGVEEGSGMVLISHPDSEKIQQWAHQHQQTLVPITLATEGNNHA